MKRAATVTFAFGFGAMGALLFYFVMLVFTAESIMVAESPAKWVETKWPFLMDQWGYGRAFECAPVDCGVQLKLFIRGKIGFCSNTMGVADDAELERLSDFDFMAGPVVPVDKGHGINIASMSGRLRAYEIVGSLRSRQTAISIAYNNNSDAVVATVVVDGSPVNVAEPAVVQFLSRPTMLRWVTTAFSP